MDDEAPKQQTIQCDSEQDMIAKMARLMENEREGELAFMPVYDFQLTPERVPVQDLKIGDSYMALDAMVAPHNPKNGRPPVLQVITSMNRVVDVEVKADSVGMSVARDGAGCILPPDEAAKLRHVLNVYINSSLEAAFEKKGRLAKVVGGIYLAARKNPFMAGVWMNSVVMAAFFLGWYAVIKPLFFG